MSNNEQLKYQEAWKSGAEGQSKTAWHIFNYLKNRYKDNKTAKILDIGCGNGCVVELLRQEGFTNVYGLDITLEGLKQHNAMIKFNQPTPIFTPKIENYTESSIWSTPFKDNEFDFTFSVDVLEHIPPDLVNQTIKEILRITSIETIHCIATFRDKRAGFDFHLTVQPINWWKEQFKILNNNKLYEVILLDRTQFLKTVISNYMGK